MPYAILRFSKQRGGPARAIEAHHERRKEAYKSNPDIDMERSQLNYHLIRPNASYYHEIQSRIEQAGCKVRKDSIKFVDTILTASPEFFENRTPVETREFFNSALNFMKQEIGEKNIFSAVVHMDEKTPHMHLCFVPLTSDNRLTAKEILGNRLKLVQWQDKYYSHMSEAFPELERGHAAMETGRKHIPMKLYKQSVNLSRQMQEIKTALKDIGSFNAAKKRDQVLTILQKWVPGVESFQTQIQKLDKEFQGLRDNIAELTQTVDAKDRQNWEMTMQLGVLKSELLEFQEACACIPNEIWDKYLNERWNEQEYEGWEMD